MTDDHSRDRRRAVLLSGRPASTVFWLALPVLLEQLLSFCVGFYDTYLAGRIGADSTSAIGLAAYVGWLASMLFGLVGTGTTALVARHWGAGDFSSANRVLNQSVLMAALAGGVVYLLIATSAPWVADFLDMTGETRRVVVRYLRWDGLGHIFGGVTLVGAAGLRGSGDMRSPLAILGSVSVVNVILSSALVFGVGPLPFTGGRMLIEPLGIDGIVAGTVSARCLGGIVMLVALRRGLNGLQLQRSQLRLSGDVSRRILRIGLPAAADGMCMWCGHMLFLRVIANLSDGGFQNAIFAAHIIGIQVEAVTYLPAVAWGQASATAIGQSLGANNVVRARRFGHVAVGQCAILAAAITVTFYLGAGAIYRFMHVDPAVHMAGTAPFRFMAFFQVPLVVSIVYVISLRGAGDTRVPLFITLFGVFVMRLPVAYVCGVVLEGGLFGAWIGMAADVVLRAVLASGRYAQGGWVRTKV